MTDRSETDLPTPAKATPQAVPQDAAVRAAIRQAANQAAAVACRCQPLDRRRLEKLGDEILSRLNLSQEFLGFVMVAIGSEFWRESFAATPYNRRLLVLPHCLRKKVVCKGAYSAEGLECARCGACAICELQSEAEKLGYGVIISEGTPAVVQAITSGRADAILGVACLDSLEKCFRRVFQMGVPYAGIPLLGNGCVETEAEIDAIREMLRVHSNGGVRSSPGYGPLLRLAKGLFEPAELRRLLAGELGLGGGAGAEAQDADRGATGEAEAIVLDWLSRAGKRFRPFITLASYAAAQRPSGESPGPGADAIADTVKCVALAMEVFHKASLAHDDVEDEDEFRYGQPTIHTRYGVPTAINSGDYLVGLGYRLVAARAAALGADCACDILARLSDAHVKLCRGQGAELLLTRDPRLRPSPGDVLAIYALKTAPAFAAAMYAGMRIVGPVGRDGERVTAFCRHMGVGYQILDDLDDLRPEAAQEQPLGQDFLRRRPTVLRAMAAQAGADEPLDRIWRDSAELPAAELVRQVREVYEQSGSIEKALRLVGKCRRRALEIAGEVERPALRDLMLFLLSVVLGEEDAYFSGE
jgi:geranylgeranyl pyrophosphate synthase